MHYATCILRFYETLDVQFFQCRDEWFGVKLSGDAFTILAKFVLKTIFGAVSNFIVILSGSIISITYLRSKYDRMHNAA